MKFAVIGDIHSNKYALESVLKDIKSRHVDAILSTGDLVGYLPYPNEVIQKMRENHVFVVKGNHDEVIANAKLITYEQLKCYEDKEIQEKASYLYTNHVITDECRDYLKNLPTQLIFNVSGKKVQVVHGSHRNNTEYLYDNGNLDEVVKTVDADILICGHTHIPYHKKVAHVDFINVGSVGKPKTGDALATYTIIDVKESNLSVKLIKVSYEIEKLVADIESNSMISNDLIEMLRKGY